MEQVQKISTPGCGWVREGTSRIGGIRPMWSAGGLGLGGRLQGRRRRADPPAGCGKIYGLFEFFVTTTPPVSIRAHFEPALIRRIAPASCPASCLRVGVTWRPVVLAASFVSGQRQRSRLPHGDNAPIRRGFFEGHAGETRLGEVAPHLTKRVTFALSRMHEQRGVFCHRQRT